MVKVSVVVLTFNRKNLLKETIDSILAQTYRNFELIIVDNCSKDGTEKFVKSCKDKRIRYFRNPNYGVIAVNLNYGIARAKGEYIALCDDDDLWLPGKLEQEVAVLDKKKDVALVCTNGINFSASGDHGLFVKKRASPYITQRDLLIRSVIIQSSVLFRKKVIDEVGGPFNVLPEYFTAEEFELWLRILSSKKIYMIQAPLVKYRTHAGAYRSSGVKGLQICKKIVGDLRKKGYVSESNYRLFMLRHYALFVPKLLGLDALYRKLI